MNDETAYKLVGTEIGRLISSVPGPEFGSHMLTFLRKAAHVRNFGAYFLSNVESSRPVLSFWSGEISDYWFIRNGRSLLQDSDRVADLRRSLSNAGTETPNLEYWTPAETSKLAKMYQKAKLFGRVAASSSKGRSGLQSFYLRDARDGAFSAEEVARLSVAIPIAHALIELRHKLVGSEANRSHHVNDVSYMRRRRVGPFGILSAREAEVCDAIVSGLSAQETALQIEISVHTVRKLRQRAYRKLEVTSAGQVASLVLRQKAQNIAAEA